MQKLYADLVKPLLVQDGPAGLYPRPRVFMEGKDLEGFNASFSYGFFTESASFHPARGAGVHPYDEVLAFAGIDLGTSVFTRPFMVHIPPGVRHCPLRYTKVYDPAKPMIHQDLVFAGEYVRKPAE